MMRLSRISHGLGAPRRPAFGRRQLWLSAFLLAFSGPAQAIDPDLAPEAAAPLDIGLTTQAALVAAQQRPALLDPHLPALPRSSAEAARVAAITALTGDFSRAEPFEAKPGGAATVRRRSSSDAFSLLSANMPFAREMEFKLGNALFRKSWVAAPASTLASDGLGPLYNARGCQDCHLKDGRGHPPAAATDSAVSMFLRLSRPALPMPSPAPRLAEDASAEPDAVAQIADWIATRPDPVYGSQLQDFAANGLPAEGQLAITWTPYPVVLADGAIITLRRPSYQITDPGYGTLAPDLQLSPRVAPQMIGLGLLEAVPAADILALADPADRDGDGISGRAALVPSLEFGAPMLGRFGLKAGSATIREQSSAAFSGDMGLSTPLHPDPWGECSTAQTACRNAPHGQEPGLRDGLEVDAASLDLVTFYARNLAVPARDSSQEPQVLRGKALFYRLNCTGCHRPKFVTHRLQDQPEQSFQLIWPYSDLLLHDMGPDLADHRPEGTATGTEWRTPPLWGIGLTQHVSGQTSFLHDGRARSLLEAVLWHGGEAGPARDGVIALGREDRADLIAFLESL